MIKFLSSTLLIAAQFTATAPSAVSQPYTLTGSIEVWEGLRVLTSVLSGQRWQYGNLGVVRSEYERCNAILAIKVISVPS
jgi:hypothetical protein